MNLKNDILTIKSVDFKDRLRKSLIEPWFFVFIAILFVLTLFYPLAWTIIILLTGLFIWMNYKAMKCFVTKIEIDGNDIKLTYMKYDKQMPSLTIPIKDLTVDYFDNGKGISSLVSKHIGIGLKGTVMLRQYKAHGWTKDIMISTTEKLNRLKRKETKHNTWL